KKRQNRQSRKAHRNLLTGERHSTGASDQTNHFRRGQFTFAREFHLDRRADHPSAECGWLRHPRPTVHSIWPCGSSVGRKTSLLLSSPNADRFIRMKCMFGQAMLISEISGTAAS